MHRNIIFLSNNPPLKHKGSGISVLLYNIILTLKAQYNVGLITFRQGFGVSNIDIKADNENIDIIICNHLQIKRENLVSKIFNKLYYLISFPLYLKTIFSKYNSDKSVIITVVGASISPVWKSVCLMLFLKKAKHCLYIVDDLELINKRINDKIELFFIKIILPFTVKRADLLLCISDGLKKTYEEKYNKSSIVLLPHFKKINVLADKAKINKEFIFLFTGGLSILYNNTLQLFALAIEKIARNTGINNIKLIIQTYSSISEYEKLNFSDKYVSYLTSNNRENLIDIYKTCDCFLIPYSFDDNDRYLVSTSFPQKIAELIQYGKKLLIVAPNYSSVSEFFKKNNLKYLLNSNYPNDIDNIIRTLIDDNDSLILLNYIKAYEENLSKDAVINVFKKVINTLEKQ